MRYHADNLESSKKNVYLNMENFKVVYQPKEKMGKYKRFFVTMKSLKNYVGEENANKAIRRAENSKGDKYSVQLRKYGRIDFYIN